METRIQSFPVLRASNVRWSILALMCAAASVAYLQRTAISVPAEQIQSDLGLTSSQLGTVMSVFYWGYAAMQIPSGWLADRWGNRHALTLFVLTWSLLTASVSLTDSYVSLLTLWFLAGAAQAGVFPCATSALASWMPSSARGFSSGALGAFMNVGAAVSTALAGMLLLHTSWRMVIVLVALPGVVWGVIYFWWFRNRPEQHRRVNSSELRLIAEGNSANDAQQRSRPRLNWGRLLRKPILWAICSQQFFRAAGYIFFGTWFPLYLQKERGISMEESGFLSSLPPLCAVVGALSGGFVADRLLVITGSKRISRQGVAAAGSLACAILVASSLAIDNVHAAVVVIAAGTFCAFFGGVISYAVTMDMGGRYVATVFGLMNMSGNIGAALMPSAVGRVLDSTQNWTAVIWMVAAAYIVAAICWLLINPDGSLVDSPALEPS